MNTSVFSFILNLPSQLIWRWYRDHLSGFRESEASGEHYQHDLTVSSDETVRVPIYKKENFGTSMAVDEKQIGEEMHTIISNRDTGKIALMVRSMRFEDLRSLLDVESRLCRNVETLTRDLSPLYAKVGDELFFNSSPVADKFHIIRSLMDACQDVRVRYRQDLLRDRRLKYQEHKKLEKEHKKESLLSAKKIKKIKGEKSPFFIVFLQLSKSKYNVQRYKFYRTTDLNPAIILYKGHKY